MWHGLKRGEGVWLQNHQLWGYKIVLIILKWWLEKWNVFFVLKSYLETLEGSCLEKMLPEEVLESFWPPDVQKQTLSIEACASALDKMTLAWKHYLKHKTIASLCDAWCTWVNSLKSIWILRKKYLLNIWEASLVWKMIMTTTSHSGWGFISRLFNVLNIKCWKGFHLSLMYWKYFKLQHLTGPVTLLLPWPHGTIILLISLSAFVLVIMN